jgi:TPR repeat protein
MKFNRLIFLIILGGWVLAASVVQAEGWTPPDYARLSLNESQLEQCRQLSKPTYAEVRTAMANQQYELALEQLGEVEANSPAEVNYLYGKIQYLQAYQQANQRLVAQPEPGKLAIAKKFIVLAATQGFAEALYDQALLFTEPVNVAGKSALLKKAADQKFVPAMLKLAEHYFYATKTFEERTEAQSLIRGAAEISGEGKLRLASYYLHEDKQLAGLAGYDRDINKAIALLHRAASECNSQAAFKLYTMSASEHKPNDLPEAKAHYWLEVSAQLGSAKAQGELAEYYYKIVEDGEQAVYWATQAVDNGDLKALLTLGRVYYQGAGVDKDLEKALGYFEKALAIDSDNRLVLNQLGVMYYKGEGSEVNFRKAASLCERAANKGQPGCQYYLGLMYVNGEGVTQDIDTGINWMKRSAAQDFSIAKNWLRENW